MTAQRKKSYAGEGKAIRPCLRCGEKFLTTPEYRICSSCREDEYYLDCCGGINAVAEGKGKEK